MPKRDGVFDHDLGELPPSVWRDTRFDRRAVSGAHQLRPPLSVQVALLARALERIDLEFVHETARKKHACSACREGVVTAPCRGKVIVKGILGASYLEHVIVERFAQHQPYHRLESQYRAEGLDISRDVLCSSMHRCAELLDPIAEQLRGEVLAEPLVHTDGTPVTMAKSADGGARQARLWV